MGQTPSYELSAWPARLRRQPLPDLAHPDVERRRQVRPAERIRRAGVEGRRNLGADRPRTGSLCDYEPLHVLGEEREGDSIAGLYRDLPLTAAAHPKRYGRRCPAAGETKAERVATRTALARPGYGAERAERHEYEWPACSRVSTKGGRFPRFAPSGIERETGRERKSDEQASHTGGTDARRLEVPRSVER